ncbi:biotin/lipoyl-binding protein [Lacticaseibacillus rhamnosus]
MRVVNYVTAVNARIQGMVVDVPITPNQHIKKGQVLFRLDPRPIEIEISGFRAQIEALQAQLLSAGASSTGYNEQLRNARGARDAIAAGRDMLYDYCRDHGVEHRRLGKLIVVVIIGTPSSVVAFRFDIRSYASMSVLPTQLARRCCRAR